MTFDKPIGSWKTDAGEANITLKEKIGKPYSNPQQAATAAAKLAQEQSIQTAIVREDKDTYRLYEINDGALSSNLNMRQKVNLTDEGKALGVVDFVGEDGQLLGYQSYSLKAVQARSTYDRQAFAQDPHTPNEILCVLAQDPNEVVRASVASQFVTLDLFQQLAQDPAPTVREAVARNIDTPDEVLRQLAQDPAPTVRIYLAKNLKTPPDVLQQLAQDPSHKVIWAILESRRIPFNDIFFLSNGHIPSTQELEDLHCQFRSDQPDIQNYFRQTLLNYIKAHPITF